jgi:hypothetical protein
VLNNNDIMKKLRIALHLKDTDIVEILKLAEFEITPSELSAIFRKEDQDNYRPCGDQILRRFLDGLIIRNRGALAPKKQEAPKKPAPEPWQKVAPWSKKGNGRPKA